MSWPIALAMLAATAYQAYEAQRKKGGDTAPQYPQSSMMDPGTAARFLQDSFQRYLGRNPTESEYAGFGDALVNRTIDPQGLMLFIQGSSEYQRKVAPSVAQEYLAAIGTSDEAAMRQAMGLGQEQAVAQMRRLGRAQGSAIPAAFAQVAGRAGTELAAQRQQYLAPLMTQLYGGPVQQAAQFAPQMAQLGLQRGWQEGDLNKQLQAYSRYYDLAMRQARENQQYQLYGSLIGAAGQAYGGYLSRPSGYTNYYPVG